VETQSCYTAVSWNVTNWCSRVVRELAGGGSWARYSHIMPRQLRHFAEEGAVTPSFTIFKWILRFNQSVQIETWRQTGTAAAVHGNSNRLASQISRLICTFVRSNVSPACSSDSQLLRCFIAAVCSCLSQPGQLIGCREHPARLRVPPDVGSVRRCFVRFAGSRRCKATAWICFHTSPARIAISAAAAMALTRQLAPLCFAKTPVKTSIRA